MHYIQSIEDTDGNRNLSSTNILALIIVILSYALVPILVLICIILFLYLFNYINSFIEYGELIYGIYSLAFGLIIFVLLYSIKKLLNWLKND